MILMPKSAIDVSADEEVERGKRGNEAGSVMNRFQALLYRLG